MKNKEEIMAQTTDKPIDLSPEKSENERIKYGYSRPAWKKVKRCHEAMDERLLDTVSTYISKSVTVGSDLNTIPQIELYKQYDNNWRQFIKEVILRAYPKGDEAPTRNRLLNIFSNKVDELRKKSGDKKVITE